MRKIAVALVLIFIAACGGSGGGGYGASGNPGGYPSSQPTPSPSPSPSASPSTTTASDKWTTLIAEYTNTQGPSFHCDYPEEVSFFNDGRYATAECHHGQGDSKQGNLTADEFQKLTQLADAVSTMQRGQQFCVEVGTLLVRSIEITLPHNIETPIYKEGSMGLCYVGDEAKTNALRDYMEELRVKYYPQGRPE